MRANCARRLESTSVSATKAATPRPSDSTTEGVSAPGRLRLASASRQTTEAGRGARRASAIAANATSRSPTIAAAEATTTTSATLRCGPERIASAASASAARPAASR